MVQQPSQRRPRMMHLDYQVILPLTLMVKLAPLQVKQP